MYMWNEGFCIVVFIYEIYGMAVLGILNEGDKRTTNIWGKSGVSACVYVCPFGWICIYLHGVSTLCCIIVMRLIFLSDFIFK
jgi:hypothetical protein